MRRGTNNCVLLTCTRSTASFRNFAFRRKPKSAWGKRIVARMNHGYGSQIVAKFNNESHSQLQHFNFKFNDFLSTQQNKVVNFNFSFSIQRFSFNINKIKVSTSTIKKLCQQQKIHVNKLGPSGSDLAERDCNKTVTIK